MDTTMFHISYGALWILVILQGLILVGVVRIVYQLQQSGTVARKDVAPGEQAPAFRATDLSGSIISSTEFAGRRFVLLFVSPGCPQCADALQDIAYLEEKAHGEAIVVCRAEREECVRLTEHLRLSVPVIADEDDKISRNYRVVLVPTAVLIDGESRIVSYGEPTQLQSKEIQGTVSTPTPSDGRGDELR